MTSHSRAVRICRGLAALLTLGTLVIGAPIVMYMLEGSPIPDRIPDWETVSAFLMRPDTDGQAFLATLDVIGWAAWLVFTAIILTEALACLAGFTASLPRPVQPVQRLVRDMVASITLAFGTAAVLANPASASVHTTSGTAATAPHNPEDAFSASPARHDPDYQGAQLQVVERGDTLWDIARRTYGSGAQYPKIFKASRTIDQPDGLPPLTDPDELHPGQRIRLPHIHRHGTARHAPQPSAPHKATSAPHHAPGHDHRGPAAAEQYTDPRNDASEPATPPHASSVPKQPPHSPDGTPTPHPHESNKGTAPGNAPSAFTLPTGSRIGLGLAAAVSVALATGRIHRRRRARAGADVEAVTTAEPPPPDAVAKAHRANLDTYADRNQPVPTDAELVITDRDTEPPDSLILGTRDGRPTALSLHGLNLGVCGDGAVPFARALVTELLAKAHRDRAELVITQPDAETLYPHLTGELPGLTITPTLDDAAFRLEAEFVHRSRLMEAANQPDLTALRLHDPAEPLPTLLLVTSVTDETKQTLELIIRLGRRYGIGSLILGTGPADATNIRLAAGGTVTDVGGPYADILTGASLFHLTAEDAVGMLSTIRTAADDPATGSPSPAPPATESESAVIEHTLAEPPAAADGTTGHPVKLQLLGSIRVSTADGPISTGLRTSARDLLAYLALNPNGITREQGTAALWPDHTQSQANDLFKTAVTTARRALRTTTGLKEPAFINRTGILYRLDPHLFEVDLWNLSTAITRARQALDDADRTRAVQSIVDLYTADFAVGRNYEWADNHRVYLRRTVTNTLARLATDLQEQHPDDATSALEHAIKHDPYSESAYRSLMTLDARLGRHDAVQRTFHLLATRLADLGTEPTPETHQLLSDLRATPPQQAP
ncbi:LysM peptidoglycan-binding domain-containing protein [Actinomadura sp. LD22]|uniref:LysM peptidoglycan-binding domain-containing protein n=1 Tax=Actinomadura physcomitrii TaxID=2650748 RepID=A0A6I4MNF4_9ACTN|nr:BTAD domain-containing putative transcriptional regulator [Actinomadura physcomitrii]MWA06500.1 LysM peptidoglycan-binding domain-containing protein [Actinomadura physcomitrii]